MRIRFAAVLFGMVAACAPAAEAGGNYLAVGSDRAEFFQIVEAPDRSLSGSAVFVQVTDVGKVETKQYALTGAKEGASLQIVLKSGAWGLGDAVLIGEEQAGRLKLTAASPASGLASGTYTRATTSDFERANANLGVLAKERASRKAQADAIRVAERDIEDSARNLDSLEREAKHFLRNQAEGIAFLAKIRTDYALAEKRMSALIANAPHRSDPIEQRNDQIDLHHALMDIEYQARDIDSNLIDGIGNHVGFAKSLREKLSGFDARCEFSRKGSPSGVQQTTVDRWLASCRALAIAAVRAQDAFGTVDQLAEESRAELDRSQKQRGALLRP